MIRLANGLSSTEGSHRFELYHKSHTQLPHSSLKLERIQSKFSQTDYKQRPRQHCYSSRTSQPHHKRTLEPADSETVRTIFPRHTAK
ncbi:High affinity cAMP-specific and IBMX-insensitive 3',5'-cyclic phosphodiesterase 8A [Frankliniella fusca]|uniref:High affinity cAMP-specific and IBMX-insensitive 3',5'-cyclic phosphodiesterase 8A n=1 Tax=Frankliniella fusca TaxID=407009 RepID=A0AAE1LTE8_9NEOP|nr:High affinity cAMP-specific and IBMX-insensitive 3',5'-cyclic phosphodiesterase 8A [Frankliniella fusca]